MRKWHWIFPGIVVAAVAVSVAKRPPATVGEEWLSMMNAHHLGTREALLLMDYSPDRELVSAARVQGISRGTGSAGYGTQPDVVADQEWVRCEDATLFWPAGAALRDSLAKARARLEKELDDARQTAAIAQGETSLARLNDEELMLAWIHADRGVLGEMEDQTGAARQALLMMSEQNPGPVLMLSVGEDHVYVLPGERTRDAAWCELAAFEKSGWQLWRGVLRVDGAPSTEHVRTMAVVTAEEALNPPKTQPGLPAFTHF